MQSSMEQSDEGMEKIQIFFGKYVKKIDKVYGKVLHCTSIFADIPAETPEYTAIPL